MHHISFGSWEIYTSFKQIYISFKQIQAARENSDGTLENLGGPAMISVSYFYFRVLFFSVIYSSNHLFS